MSGGSAGIRTLGLRLRRPGVRITMFHLNQVRHETNENKLYSLQPTKLSNRA